MVDFVCDFLQFYQIASKELPLVVDLILSMGIIRHRTVSEYVHEIRHHLITLLPLANERLVSVGIIERILDLANQESILFVYEFQNIFWGENCRRALAIAETRCGEPILGQTMAHRVPVVQVKRKAAAAGTWLMLSHMFAHSVCCGLSHNCVTFWDRWEHKSFLCKLKPS